MTSPSARKYSFGASLINENGKTIIPELESAKRASYQEGYNEGYRVAQSEIEADTKIVLNKCQHELQQLVMAQSKAYEYINGSIISTTLEITNKLFPEILQKSAEELVLKFIQDVLSNVDQSSKITFAVHVDLLESIKKRTENLIDTQTNKIIIEQGKDYERFDCKAEWDDGGIEQFPYKVIEEVERALKIYLENVPVASNLKDEELQENIESTGEEDV